MYWYRLDQPRTGLLYNCGSFYSRCSLLELEMFIGYIFGDTFSLLKVKCTVRKTFQIEYKSPAFVLLEQRWGVSSAFLALFSFSDTLTYSYWIFMTCNCEAKRIFFFFFFPWLLAHKTVWCYCWTQQSDTGPWSVDRWLCLLHFCSKDLGRSFLVSINQIYFSCQSENVTSTSRKLLWVELGLLDTFGTD